MVLLAVSTEELADWTLPTNSAWRVSVSACSLEVPNRLRIPSVYVTLVNSRAGSRVGSRQASGGDRSPVAVRGAATDWAVAPLVELFREERYVVPGPGHSESAVRLS